ncbi:hypothetical protein EDB81DRAFT_670095 [Dactylonectria macrodidyma]|uniref:Uncharacterized protein n=1 Tax=Dactylonectria macrodidyma TaxID=307937 RepID=A0A9P9D6I7_9HYPO|nr:hypothetical protein EDB81DRAFT_670095 [Dactylonectria macrodidyma]
MAQIVNTLTYKNTNLAGKLLSVARCLAPLSSYITASFTQHSYRQYSLAQFYHQNIPSHYTNSHPCTTMWRQNMSFEEKHREIGNFIGILPCDLGLQLNLERKI